MTKKSRRVAKARRALLSLSLVLVVAFAAVGGTVAWLTAETSTITNTFTVGEVKIELDESVDTNLSADFKMIPGTKYLKDPKVTVKANSEKCYLFVKFEELNGVANFITYSSKLKETDWHLVDATTNVWYRIVDSSDQDQSFYLLDGTTEQVIDITKLADTDATNDKTSGQNGYVAVKDSVSKDDMPAANTAKTDLPQLKYTAYAVQYENMADAEAAWAKVNP